MHCFIIEHRLQFPYAQFDPSKTPWNEIFDRLKYVSVESQRGHFVGPERDGQVEVKEFLALRLAGSECCLLELAFHGIAGRNSRRLIMVKQRGQAKIEKLKAIGDAEPDGVSRSALRLISILDLFLSMRRPLSTQEVVSNTSLPRTTAYEIIRALVSTNYLERMAERGKYRLGVRAYELGICYRDQVSLIKDGQPILEALTAEINETTQLSILDNDHVLVLLKCEGTQAITIISKVGSRIPVNWGASGRLLVSDWPQEELRGKLPSMLTPSPTGLAPTNVRVFMEQVKQARERGYDVQLSQANRHAGSLSAPVIDAAGKCVATVSSVVPEYRLVPERIPMLVAALQTAARKLSRTFGG